MDMLSKQGVFFDRFYVPMVGTARSVFGMITGIHDVAEVETATSNPQIVDQYTLVNSLKGYQKKYFIGGSASWRNIRGLLNKNIPDMKIIEQKDLDYPRLDVWGISDHDLFATAHGNLTSLETKEPFFAIIQTATNHRPYSIPKNIDIFNKANSDAKKSKISKRVFVLGNMTTFPIAMYCSAKFYELLGYDAHFEHIEQFSHMELFSAKIGDTVIVFEQKNAHFWRSRN